MGANGDGIAAMGRSYMGAINQAISTPLPYKRRSPCFPFSSSIVPVEKNQNTCRKGTAGTRLGRFSEKNRIYHVSTATHGREPFFRSFENGRRVVRALNCEEQRGHAVTMAFVVMPDHLHWLVQLIGNRSLSESVCVVKSCSARDINAATGRRGNIWQRGFFDRAIRKDDDLLGIARYIVANPLRAGIVDSVGGYPLWDAMWL
jgi:putative transposase